MPRFKTKQQGYGLAKRQWICKICGRWHGKKPELCDECNSKDLLYCASKDEARRYTVLRDLQRKGYISGLQCQVAYPVFINNIKIFTYRADFLYYDSDGDKHVEDVKAHNMSVTDPVFKLKKAAVEAYYGIEIEIYMRGKKK